MILELSAEGGGGGGRGGGQGPTDKKVLTFLYVF